MSSPVVVTPLVPRGANKAKKKRPGFRPVGKSSKGASTSSAKVETNKSTSTPTTTPASNNNETTAHPEKVNQQQGEAESTTQQQSGEIHEPAAASITGKNTIVPKGRPSLGPAKSAARKRVLRPGILVGVRNIKADNSSLQDKRQRDDETAAFQTDGTSTSTTKLNSATTTSTNTGASTVPVVTQLDPPPSQDYDILERLATEDPNGVRLNSFCSRFKQPRRRRAPGAANANRAVHNNNHNNTQGSSTSNNNNSHNQNLNAFHEKEERERTPDPAGNPAVQIVDGEIVLQESSLVVAGQRRTVQEVEEEFQDVVEEDAHLAIVGASYNSFVHRKGPKRWTLKDTKLFYEGLRMLGTDFCSMEALFENRSRKQLKRKYQMELVKNPQLVELALDPKNKKTVDLTIFNVEVDPEAIEAAKNEEPPPYIPTDDDHLQNNTKRERDENGNDPSSKVHWQDVVEEDAEEEVEKQRAAGRAASLSTTNRVSNRIPIGLWGDEPALVDREHADHHDFPEPSMDDFFHEQQDDMVVDEPQLHDMDDVGVQQVKRDNANTTDTPSEEPMETAANSISLVPSKKAVKSKKPKFRNVPRKKK